MRKFFLALVAVASFAYLSGVPAGAVNCSKYAPYYHQTHADSPGSLLADLFFLPFTAGVAVIAAPVAIPQVQERTRDAEGNAVYGKILCGPKNHANRLIQNIPKIKTNFN